MRIIISFLILFFSYSAHAATDSFFTTVAYDGKNSLFLGWKKDDKEEIISKVLEYKIDDKTSHQISLPEGLNKSDVVGIIPDADNIAILTYKPEDKTPRVHVLKRSTNTWKEKGKAPCLSFAKITLMKSRLVFHCESLNRRGKTRITRKNLELGKDRIDLRGFVRVPDFLIRYKGLQVFLEGMAPYWEKMRIRKDEVDTFVSASDFED